MSFNTGDYYSGNWRRNLFHGTGKILYKNGVFKSYEGEWVNNRKNGKGIMVFNNLDTFEGFFRDDLVCIFYFQQFLKDFFIYLFFFLFRCMVLGYILFRKEVLLKVNGFVVVLMVKLFLQK